MSILVLFGIVLVVVNDLGTNLVSEEWASRDCDLTLAQRECPECASEYGCVKCDRRRTQKIKKWRGQSALLSIIDRRAANMNKYWNMNGKQALFSTSPYYTYSIHSLGRYSCNFDKLWAKPAFNGNGARVLLIQSWFQESQAGRQCKGRQPRNVWLSTRSTSRQPLSLSNRTKSQSWDLCRVELKN